MTWLLKLFPGQWAIYAGALAAAVALGGTAAWQFQGARIDKVKAEFALFVGQTRALGEAAKKEAAAQKERDLQSKLKADYENATSLAALRADIKRLREQRAGTSYVPAAASSASRPDRACFDRAELERAVRTFDSEVQGLVDEGSETTVKLNTARIWAQERRSTLP